MRGLTRHEECDDGENHGTREAAENAHFARAEAEPGIRRVAAAEIVGQCCDEKRGNVRAHMPAIGEQRHGIERDAGDNFDDHHCGGNADHDTRSMLRSRCVRGVVVGMAPCAGVGPMHEEMIWTTPEVSANRSSGLAESLNFIVALLAMPRRVGGRCRIGLRAYGQFQQCVRFA